VSALDALLHRLADLPPVLIYLVIGTGAAVENVLPPVPADTFVLLGAFLTGFGRATAWLVFLWTWVGNMSSAIGIYYLSGRYGPRFFRTRVGHAILHPGQLEQISRFYFRWGLPAIFVSRFLPGLRAVVPVFAGVCGVPLRRVFVPLATASALWYGALVYLGAIAGRNWDQILAWSDRLGSILLWAAALLTALLAGWWIRSRRRRRS
jgi:membrane protein DedA with SNARE-associated domain